jgi:hypothetical protein
VISELSSFVYIGWHHTYRLEKEQTIINTATHSVGVTVTEGNWNEKYEELAADECKVFPHRCNLA